MLVHFTKNNTFFYSDSNGIWTARLLNVLIVLFFVLVLLNLIVNLKYLIKDGFFFKKNSAASEKKEDNGIKKFISFLRRKFPDLLLVIYYVFSSICFKKYTLIVPFALAVLINYLSDSVVMRKSALQSNPFGQMKKAKFLKIVFVIPLYYLGIFKTVYFDNSERLFDINTKPLEKSIRYIIVTGIFFGIGLIILIFTTVKATSWYVNFYDKTYPKSYLKYYFVYTLVPLFIATFLFNRYVMSKGDSYLVPLISAVVWFFACLLHLMTVWGYKEKGYKVNPDPDVEEPDIFEKRNNILDGFYSILVISSTYITLISFVLD